MGEGWRLVLIVVAIWTAIPAAVWLTGSTFGQRCDRAFPADPARAELCVYNLSKGNAP